MTPHVQDQATSRSRRLRALAGSSLVLAAAVAGGLASSAGAVNATVLGQTRDNPRPSCSGEASEECQITGQVTGFQRSAAGQSNLFKAPRNGKVHAWSVNLASPSQEERDIFGEAAQTDEFGESPTAGISILRKGKDREFKLLRSSPVLRVGAYYGDEPIFTLEQPLRIRKDNVVALTTATWLPAFAFKGQGPKDVWMASRTKKNCEVPASVPADERLDYFFAHTKPHRKVGSDRKYQCSYDNARLLYRAYFVPG